jgi:hypothetical protein
MSLQVGVRRLAVSVTSVALLAALGALLHAQAINNPPLAPTSILVFPQRDFVSSSGFLATDLVTVEVFHPTDLIHAASRATNVVPQDDTTTPGFDGIVEVNHPGGACWETITPDIRFGDHVRTTARDPFGNIRTIDETIVANVVAKRPVQVALDTVEIHGTAQNADGTPINITQLEQRLVAPRDAFDLNGRRTLRATSVAGANDGVLVYDPVNATNPKGINWTAVYSGLDSADVTRALNAESRILWLGTNPAVIVENTVYENGAAIFPGPAAPCTAPLEKLPPPPGSELIPPTQPTNLVAQLSGANSVHLSWSASTDNVGVTSYGVYRNGVAIANVQNIDGTAPAPTLYEDLNVPAGTYTYTVDAADEVGNRSPVSNAVTVRTTTQQATNYALCSTNGGAEPCISDPPAPSPTQVQIIAFPGRDFTSSSGYTEQDSSVTVQVIRNGLLISSANVFPVDDPTTIGFDGIVEVNHPGGGCWQGVTPDLRANDVVRQIAYAPDGVTVRRIDQIHVANISVERPFIVKLPTAGQADGVIAVHGTAMDADGNQIPLGNIEQRLVARRDQFDFNGRRTIRAGGAGKDGEFVYDATNNASGMKFTATYSGLDETDVYRAVGGTTSAGVTFTGAESRIIYLGDPPVVAPSMTIYENSDLIISGPAAAACFAPIEAIDTQAPSTPIPVASQTAANAVTLSWSPSTDDTYVNGYGVYRRDDDVAGADFVRIRNVGATLPGTATQFTFVDTNVPVGNHTYAVDAVDSASPLKVNYPNAFQGANTTDPILLGVEWGNRSALGTAQPLKQTDVLPPSTPTNLVARVVVKPAPAQDQVVLTWTPSTDNVGVTSYRVYRNGVALTPDVTGAPPATTFTDTVPGAPVNTTVTYSYTVDAADAVPNRSGRSAPVSAVVTQKADTSRPTTPGAFAASTRDVYATATAPAIGPHDVRLSWTAAADPNGGVTGYGIYRRPAASIAGTDPRAAFTAAQKIADVNGTTLTFTDLNVPTGMYDYGADAVDSAANRSVQTPAALDVVSVDDPPLGKHSIIPFPQRDFVSSTGYAVTEGPITIEVIRKGKLWAKSTPIAVVEDPTTPGLGAAEVNHPGGGCWDTAKLNGLDGITPDVRPGDIVRFINKAGKADQTTVANVYADRATDRDATGALLPAGTIQTHGTAQDAAGKPLPLDSIESRLVASSADPFQVNGRRVLRAGGAGTDGTFSYDPVSATNPNGTNWTATFSGLSAADADLAKASESRAVWLGRDPVALVELTIFENGDGVVGGPAGGVCTAPAEAGPAVQFDETGAIAASFDPGALTLAFPARNTGTAVTQSLRLSNIGSADATRAITGALSVASAGFQYGPADFTLTSNTCANASVAVNGTCTVTVQFKPTTPGTHVGKLVFTDSANNSPVQVFALSGDGLDAQAPTVTAPLLKLATKAAMNVPANALAATVSATATDSSGVARMQLDQSLDGGRTWSTIATSTSGQVAASVTFSIASTYQFRAIATDALNNTSAPVVAPAYHVSISDDNSGVPKFSGSWSTQKGNAASDGAYGNTVHEATAPQAGKTNTATFTFSGTEVGLLAAVGPDRGQVSLSVDGGAAQIIDLYAPAQQQAVVAGTVFGLTAGTHTATINVLSSKNAVSSSTRVDVDGFVTKF